MSEDKDYSDVIRQKAQGEANHPEKLSIQLQAKLQGSLGARLTPSMQKAEEKVHGLAKIMTMMGLDSLKNFAKKKK